MSNTTVITIGLTASDRDNNYSSFMDGYRPGADQQQVLLPVPSFLLHGKDIEEIAEKVFIATNAPGDMPVGTLEHAVRNLWSELVRSLSSVGQGSLRSVSKGDTVTLGFDVDEDPTVACASFGWDRL